MIEQNKERAGKKRREKLDTGNKTTFFSFKAVNTVTIKTCWNTLLKMKTKKIHFSIWTTKRPGNGLWE